MINFSKVFPKTASNEFDGPKVAVWGFIVFTALMTWRAIIHMFFDKIDNQIKIIDDVIIHISTFLYLYIHICIHKHVYIY